MNSSNKTVKVVYLINQFYMHGGIQRMISNKIDAWIDQYGYDVTVITINQENKEIVYPPKNEFKFIDLGIKHANGHKPKDLFDFITRLKKIIKNEQPDLFVTTVTGIPSLLLPFIQPKFKKVLEIHSSGALSVTKSWKYKWWFLNRYYKVILLNQDEKQYYKLKNLNIIPNFIKVNDDTLRYENRDKIILAAGRIHPDKQYEHLLQIWNLLYQKYPDWKLEIFGDGDKSLIEKLNDNIKLNRLERVSIHPATINLNEVMRRSSLFCLTSKTESFGMVILECKNNMLPVISYDSPHGPRNLINHDGILVERNNIELFAEKLSELITNEKLRFELASNGFKNKNQYSERVIMNKWNSLIK